MRNILEEKRVTRYFSIGSQEIIFMALGVPTVCRRKSVAVVNLTCVLIHIIS